MKLHDFKTSALEGNGEKYSLDNAAPNADSPIEGKTVLFLGSSVTYGSASGGVSFADYIGKRDGCTVIKSAVSGTTLVESGINSYVSRLKKLDTEKVDLFVCQLSTNDASQKKELGKIIESKNLNDFDTKTIAGAIEYIICYSKEKWNCPVIFYTNPSYDSELYGEMVDILKEAEAKWDISVIDMWNDAGLNAALNKNTALYMADKIHPTKAGYLEIWTPFMDKTVFGVMKEETK
ncbi:MAG: SGNH/GDSL hydrolase family protein [Oscillospiraceae bacterium]|nr:SGNH/GDSL hydrolase family protein [Oscillospiraceae bacterium]